MLAIGGILRQDRKRLTNMSPRVFNREMKIGLKGAIEFVWKPRFLPMHFERHAYRRYNYSGRRKKGKGRPLVDSGSFRKKMLKGKHRISGTSKGAKIRLKYGRPDTFSDPRKVHLSIIKILAKSQSKQQYQNMSRPDRKKAYKRAENKFWSRAGYGRDAKEMFQERITAVHPQEVKAMNQYLHDHMTRFVGPSGKQVKTVLR